GFGDAARARVEELEGEQQNATEIARDKKEESVVAGLAPARLLIEQRLQQMELKPGEVDGEFTDETRRALRRFQREQGLDVTGYVSQETIVRLLAVKQ